MENNVTLDCNKTRDFNLTLDGKGYSGSFSKNLILRVERENGASQILSIPLRFSVHGPGTEPSPASTAVATQMEIRFTPYKGGGLEAYPEAVLWVFGADDCPGCNHLKATVLPDFLGQPSEGKAHEVIRVNLDDVDQFEFLMSLEDKMGISNPGDTPAILWKGRLIYGMDAIKKLVRKPSGGSS